MFMQSYSSVCIPCAAHAAAVEKRWMNIAEFPKSREILRFRPSTEVLSTGCGRCGNILALAAAECLLGTKSPKNIQRMHAAKAGIRLSENEYIQKVRLVHTRVEKIRGFPHFILWPKARKIAGWRGFSTESTWPISTTNHILLLSKLTERMIPCNSP